MSNNYHTQMQPNMLNDIAMEHKITQKDNNQFMSHSQQEQIKYQLQQEQLKLQMQQEQLKQEQLKTKLQQEQLNAKLQQEKIKSETNMDEIVLSDVKQTEEKQMPINSNIVPKVVTPQWTPQNVQPSSSFASNKTIADYVIIPVLIAITFILLVHPTISGYIEKYLPPMNGIKGYAIRGIFLAVLYIVIRFGVNYFYLKN